MSSKWRSSATRLGKTVLSLLLAFQAVHSLMNSPSMNAYSDDGGVDYTKFRSVEEVRAAAERRIALANQAALDALVVSVDSTPDSVSAAAEVNDVIVDSPLALAGYESSAAHEPYVVNESSAADESLAAVDDVGAASVLEMAIRFDDERSYMSEPDHVDSPPPLLVTLADRSLDAESLDDVRGGFDLEGSNLKFSFGIERAVFINGELVAHTVLNLRDLQWTVGGGGAATLQLPASAAVDAVSVIQNGGGNSFATQINPNLAGTVIQNSLNDQRIQHITTIDAAVNSAQLLRSLSVQSAIQNGLVNSLRH